ncbi:MAG: phospholipid carrier-dependent glycosyltransferase [Clostridiales bacterium]|nr:phospholipid carrier-dependent glycosyltransferase [Clostridiales bacterium]
MEKKMTKKDYLIVIVMIVVYSLMAFLNLGSMTAPIEGFTPEETRLSAIIFFDEEVDLSRITFYCGLGNDWYSAGQLDAEYLNDDNRFVELCSLKKPSNNVFKWFYQNVEVRTTAVRLTTAKFYDADNNISGIEGEFLEVAFWAKNDEELMQVGIDRVEVLNDESKGMVKMFDEQDIAVSKPSYMNTAYFDEVYFPRTAYEYIEGISPYENTHPPLGKVLIMWSMKIFGVNPFGWRFMGTLFGVFMIPLMYIFGKKMFGNSFLAFSCAFLMMFDFMHFVQTRIGTVDGFLVFFILMTYYFMYQYYMRKSYELKFVPSLLPLLLCGIFFGMAFSVKWIGLFAGIGLAFIFFQSRILEYEDYRKGNVYVERFKLKYIWGTLGMCVIFFIGIPLIIYALSYIPVFKAIESTNWIKDLLSSQKHMFTYHSGVTSTHPYASPWWQWPSMVKPVYLYLAPIRAEGEWGSIASLGNPAVWWVGLVAMVWSAWIASKKKDKRMVFIVVGYLSIILPWAFSPRDITFLYHYFACVPFLIFAIVYLMEHFLDKYLKAKKWIYIYLGLVLVLFILFYPVLSGIIVPVWVTENLRWLPSWFF